MDKGTGRKSGNSKVTVFLRGGLGNQMFQYAAGLNLAIKNNADIFLDTVFLKDRFPRPHFTYRTFDLADVFNIEPKLTAFSRAASRLPIPGVWLGADLLAMNIREASGYANIISENEQKNFDPIILKARGNSILYGRWENEKYFIENAESVRSAFHFRHPLEGEALSIAENIRDGNSISLHVRRGDYIKIKEVRKLMGDMNESYYKNAIEYIVKKVSKPDFFVFSDDIEWCKKNIPTPFSTTYVSAAAAGPKAAFHLELMSLCKHNIIANSTFSWWGAWLNENPGKIVIAPKEWSAAARASEREVIPTSWITF
jgi:Glycosyl transferase family 11